METTNFQPYVLFQHGNYVETVIREYNDVCIVDCSELGINQLFRIEWKEDNGTYTRNIARYSIEDATSVFIEHVLPIGAYISVTFKADTDIIGETPQETDITEYGTVISHNGDRVTIADELDFNGNLTSDSRVLEFSFSSSKVEIIAANLREGSN
jgi:hypothetical protein